MSAGGADGCSPPSTPLHLLEVTVISAQDLHRGRLGRRRVRAYAMAWTDGARKLRTGVDLAGGADPTWNDRFLFRVDPGFLRSETASVAVEVRGSRSLLGGDAVLGHTRIVVSTFVSSRGDGRPVGGRQVAALQLRRPRSLRPQGIVNVAVALLDGATHTVPPVYNAPGSPDAFAVKDLIVAAVRPPAPALGKIAEEEEESAALDHHGRRRRLSAFVENSGPLDARGAAVEQSKLEMKLEKWRADLSPDHGEEGGRGGKSARRRRRRSSCFFGSKEDWER